MAFYLKLTAHTDAAVLTVERWLIEEGEFVDAGRPLVMVRADAEPVSVSSDVDGILLGKNVRNGEVFKADDSLATIVSREEAGEIRIEKKLSRRDMEILRSLSLKKRRRIRSADHVKATPAARHMAYDYGIALGAVKGTGPDGRIQRTDVLKVLNSASGTYSAQKSDNPGIGRLDLTIGELENAGSEKSVEAEPAVRLGSATPLAKRIAKQYDLDLSTLAGTGRGGRITRSDVLTALDLKEPQTPALSVAPRMTPVVSEPPVEIQPELVIPADEPDEEEVSAEIAAMEDIEQEISDDIHPAAEDFESAATVETESEEPAAELKEAETAETAAAVITDSTPETAEAVEEVFTPAEGPEASEEEPEETEAAEQTEEARISPIMLDQTPEPELLEEPEPQVIELSGPGPVIELGTEPEAEEASADQKPEEGTDESAVIMAAVAASVEEADKAQQESGRPELTELPRTVRSAVITAEVDLGKIAAAAAQMADRKGAQVPDLADFAVLSAIKSCRSVFNASPQTILLDVFGEAQKRCVLTDAGNLDKLSEVAAERASGNAEEEDAAISLVIADYSKTPLLTCSGLIETNCPLVLNIGGKQERSRFSKAQIRQSQIVRLTLELDPARIRPKDGIALIERICICMDNPESILLGTEAR